VNVAIGYLESDDWTLDHKQRETSLKQSFEKNTLFIFVWQPSILSGQSGYPRAQLNNIKLIDGLGLVWSFLLSHNIGADLRNFCHHFIILGHIVTFTL